MIKYPKHRNPIAAALVKKTIIDDIARLKTEAGIHALTGNSDEGIRNAAGRLIFIVIWAWQRTEGVDLDHPDLRICIGAANSLGDLSEDKDVEKHRMSIVSGLNAATRLSEKCCKWALGNGAIELDAMLHSPHGLTVADFQAKK